MSLSKRELEFANKIASMAGYVYTIVQNKVLNANESDIEEIVSNVKIYLWKSRAKYLSRYSKIDNTSLKKWVSTFTHNNVVWYFSKKKKKDQDIDFNSENLDIACQIIGKEDSVLEAFIEGESKESMYFRYCSVLNKEDKGIFELMWKGFSHSQVADVYGITRQAVAEKFESIRIKLNKHFNYDSSKSTPNKMSQSERVKLLKSVMKIT